MEDEFEVMKLFKSDVKYSFILGCKPQPHIISALKRLMLDEMIICVWTLCQEYPIEFELTEKGFQLREYLKYNEWDWAHVLIKLIAVN